MTQHFRENIKQIIKKYNIDEEKCIIPADLILPEMCTDNNDIISILTEQFEWLLEYGKIDYCFELDSQLYWFPFTCFYNWTRNITLCMICLKPNSDKVFATKKICRASDYTAHFESRFKFIPNYFDRFIIPTRLFDINSDYDSGLEIFHQIRIVENTDNNLIVRHNADIWIIDKITYQITVNNKLLDFKDLCYGDSKYSYDLAVLLGSILDDNLNAKIINKYNDMITTSDLEDSYRYVQLYATEGDSIIS